MQRIRRSTSSSAFSSYFEIINHVYETWFSKLNFKRTRWSLKINLVKVFVFMQRLIISTSSSLFSSYVKFINHVYETWFSKLSFKRTRWFLKICKIVDELSRAKIRDFLPHYERKNLATTIFFEQRIKEKFNTWFDYYFWDCCLLYFVVPCFAVDIMSSKMLN